MQKGNTAGAIFALKNFGWDDKRVIENNITGTVKKLQRYVCQHLTQTLETFGKIIDGNMIKARNRVLRGGRASSKSWEFAGMAGYIGQNYKTRFLCVRRFQNKIKESVYTLIKNQIDNFGFNWL